MSRQVSVLPAAPAHPTRVILVEDDNDLRQGLADYLRLSGLTVVDAQSGVAFYRALRASSFDIAIVDVNLPDISGFDLAREVSGQGDMGVILLTARTSRDDRVRGYSEGADLYLTKPVDGEELLLAVRNLARRVRAAPTIVRTTALSGAIPAPTAAWRLDTSRHQLLAPDGAQLALSGREAMLLEELVRAEGATIPRHVLARQLGYGEASSESRSLDAVLRRLRQKAQEAGIEIPLRAIHAIGLRFAAPLTKI